VNLPLLHRLLAGMAKVKKAGKKHRVAHAGSELVKRLYQQSPRIGKPFVRRLRRRGSASGCDNPTAQPVLKATLEEYHAVH
jgi:hypothetical protein